MARVEIKNLGIKFNLVKQRERSLKGVLVNPFRKAARNEFWAIRNIDLLLKDGDILGITGPNGSGKSTLLRSITGIYDPDEGSIETEGQVSLLAIGAGFNKELSGIENIYLNGAVFGFSQEQIRELVPRIREFADIGDFLEQPIRTYSSGMVSRLGFAVAINLDPDILLIDEVLAVGDQAFKSKCETAVNDLIARRNRIVVIVSHNREIIESMCNRRLRLKRRPRDQHS
jgi:ABC-type polysaccharide/polyol phosphate transport system ATPase subunit